ncbi:MAG: hypothetical protein J5867_06205 [Prevotella sp.]|nr:hypothetical protein [Prevotella sp.]
MPYRRLPKTDAARLKALKTLLESDVLYSIRNRFLDYQLVNRAQPAYERLLTANEQLKLSNQAQMRVTPKIEKAQRNAALFLSHFIQVLLMAIERGEIPTKALSLYQMPEDTTAVPNIKSIDRLLDWSDKIVQGEKERIKQGGRPIYNPAIGTVTTHIDVFKDTLEQQKKLQARTQRVQDELNNIRPEVDEIILEVWNQVEKHYENEPPEVRYPECRKLGIVYYYRRHEPHDY